LLSPLFSCSPPPPLSRLEFDICSVNHLIPHDGDLGIHPFLPSFIFTNTQRNLRILRHNCRGSLL
jgi:hypothetical protein